MDLDPQQDIDTAQPARRARRSAARLNAAVAITVALQATFMGICKVKDDNIVQGMQQAQSDKLDHWSYYQARNIREDLATSTATQLEMARQLAPATAIGDYDTTIVQYRAKAKHEAKAQAEADQNTHDALNFRDDQFDLSDALLSISIALLAVASLTQLWPLYVAALVPTAFGTLMGFACLMALPIHPDALIKLLS